LIRLAANMKFHGTSPWYLFDFLCKAPPGSYSHGGFAVKESPGLSSNGISSESDRRRYYGFRRNRLDRHLDPREPWLR
jgi:hypothetical protein